MDDQDTTPPVVYGITSFGESQVVDRELSNTFRIINYNIVGPIICSCGILGNIINLIVYWRIGFKLSITVSFFSRTITDLCALVLQLFLCVWQNPSLQQSSDTGLFLYEMSYTFLGVLKTCLDRLSMWIAMLITVEQCVCIGLPLRVKEIFTASRTLSAVGICAALVLLSGLPFYMSYAVGHIPVIGTNRTRLAVYSTSSTYAGTTTAVYLNLTAKLLPLTLIGISATTLLVVLDLQKRQQKFNSTAQHQENPAVLVIPDQLAPPVLRLTRASRLSPAVSESPSRHNAGDPTQASQCGRYRPSEESSEHMRALQVPPRSQSNRAIHHLERRAPNQLADSNHRPIEEPQVFVVPDQRRQGQRLTRCPGENGQTRGVNQQLSDSLEQNQGLSLLSQQTQERMWNCSKMVATVAFIDFISSIPITVMLVISALMDPSNLLRQSNLVVVLWSFVALSEAVNASINIMVYYRKSTMYRKQFLHLVASCTPKTQVGPATVFIPPAQDQALRHRLTGRGPLIGP